MGIFPDAQGQVTHKSLVGSCRISKTFEILWLSLLPARIKKSKSKIKELESHRPNPFCEKTIIVLLNFQLGSIYKLFKSHVNYALILILRILGSIEISKGH